MADVNTITDQARRPGGMSPARRMPTSADVARAAGVSRSTVSLVLNDTPGARIPDATRDRVLTAAADLGYVVNKAAADLRRGTSLTVLAVLGGGRVDSTTTQYLPVLSEALHEIGLTLVTAMVSGDVRDQDAYSWAALRPMAVLAFGADITPSARAILAATRCVTIGDTDGADVVISVDQRAIATAGVAAMHERGRVRLLQVQPREQALADLTEARVAAFQAAAGPQALGTVRMSLRGEDALELVASMHDRSARPDGILACNDEYAARLVGLLLDAGFAVPADVAVLGVDNNPWGQWMRPALSTLMLEPGDVTGQLLGVLDAVRQGRSYPDSLPLVPSVRVVHRQTT